MYLFADKVNTDILCINGIFGLVALHKDAVHVSKYEPNLGLHTFRSINKPQQNNTSFFISMNVAVEEAGEERRDKIFAVLTG